MSFHRTVRVPRQATVHALPAGLGMFPIVPVARHRVKAPPDWNDKDYMIPMYQREALWIGFDAARWKPNAVSIGVGNINAVSGRPWQCGLQRKPQDYLVCPPQPWLDGINSGKEYVSQFVAMPLHQNLTVESQLGMPETGGLWVRVYEPKPGIFPEQPPPSPPVTAPAPMRSPELGLGAGGRIKQKIYPDPHGFEVWDLNNCTEVRVHLVNSAEYHAISGESPPPTPIDYQTYIQAGLPWFELYDELGDIPAALRIWTAEQFPTIRGACDYYCTRR